MEKFSDKKYPKVICQKVFEVNVAHIIQVLLKSNIRYSNKYYGLLACSN